MNAVLTPRVSGSDGSLIGMPGHDHMQDTPVFFVLFSFLFAILKLTLLLTCLAFYNL